jgi:hypothetical protein
MTAPCWPITAICEYVDEKKKDALWLIGDTPRSAPRPAWDRRIDPTSLSRHERFPLLRPEAVRESIRCIPRLMA